VVRSLKTKATQRLNAKNLFYPYFVGLIEGDGWISVNKKGKYVCYELGIELSIKDIQLLYKIKEILGVGNITLKNRKSINGLDLKLVRFNIRNKKHLKEIILPIFNEYPMITNKQYDFLRFKELLNNNIIYSKDLLDYKRPIKPLYNVNEILNIWYFKYWLIGFIEAEGCFSIYKSINRTSKIASFDISQTKSYEIIEAIKQFLGISANVYNNKKTQSFSIKTVKINNIDNIIKYLKNNPVKLMGNKRLQYILFLKELRTIPKYSNKINIPDNY